MREEVTREEVVREVGCERRGYERRDYGRRGCERRGYKRRDYMREEVMREEAIREEFQREDDIREDIPKYREAVIREDRGGCKRREDTIIAPLFFKVNDLKPPYRPLITTSFSSGSSKQHKHGHTSYLGLGSKSV